MAALSKNVKFDEERVCRICRKKTGSGRVVKGYEKYLEFVCEDCWKSFFGVIERSESTNFAVKFRPAAVRDDEYRQQGVFTHTVIYDTVRHLITGVVLFLINWLLSLVYPGDRLPVFGTVCFLVYGIASVVGTFISAEVFISGLFLGTPIKRGVFSCIRALAYCAVSVMSFSYLYGVFNNIFS